MDRSAFFANIRPHLGVLSQSQVDGLNVVLDEAERRGTRLASLAYMLATAWWETGKTMQPVKEAFWVKNAEAWRKAHLRYWPYYGRGFVQLTWLANYQKASKKLGVDFIANPDLVMVPANAVRIMFDGMEEGWFTAKKLDDYIDDIDESDAEDLREFIAGRRIINGTDKAKQIGEIALVFEHALRASGYGAKAAAAPAPVAKPAAAGAAAGSAVVAAPVAAAAVASASVWDHLWPWLLGGAGVAAVALVVYLVLRKKG